MKLKKVSIDRCSFKFKKPFINSGKKYEFRDVYYLIFYDESGVFGIGECAPLAGFSAEDIDEAGEDLLKIKRLLEGKDFESSIFSYGEILKSVTNLSSVRFASEQAFMNLLIKRDEFFKKKNFRNYINVNAVISESSVRDSMERFQEYVDRGFNAIKVKIGIMDFESELSMVKMIKHDFPEINLRLDVNGAWSFDEAKQKLEKLAEFDFEYIEQPVKSAEELLSLKEIFHIPLAPDESLQDPENISLFMNDDSINHLVVKPMFAGGIVASVKIIEEANLKRKKVIISSGLETGVGRSALVWLSIKPDHNLAHGLNTNKFLANDPNSKYYDAGNGSIYFDPNEFPNFSPIPC